jgi:hypothetical protein
MAAPDEADKIATGIVNRFTWTSNVVRNGRLIGQQYIVAEAIAEAIRSVRAGTVKEAVSLVESARWNAPKRKLTAAIRALISKDA